MGEVLCEVCGGQVQVNEEGTLGICLYCGTVNTISPNHKKKQNLFNRGTHLRLNKDFHGSMRTYEKLLDEDQTDPEAHWGLTLSRYGIEYVKDRKTGEYHPTLHRMQKKSILLDIDYKDALTYARPGVRKKYEERAQRIDSIYKKYDAITKNEPSYDVFICYKETDDLTGKHTKDSVFAYEIYTALTKSGLKVFFAKKTLKGKLGLDFEPLIFAALNSAKVMIVVATNPENVNAVWVKNEWERYLELSEEKNSDKTIIPVYHGMTAYDLPDELSSKQSLNMENLGFMQDLLDGIKKLLHKKGQDPVTTSYYGGVNVDALLKRGQMALEDLKWDEAENYFDQVLNLDAENGNAYLGMFLAEQHTSSVDKLKDLRLSRTQTANGQTKHVELDDGGIIKKYARQYYVYKYYSKDEIKSVFEFSGEYESYVEERKRQYQLETEFWEGNKLLNRALRFIDIEQKQLLLGVKDKVIAEMTERIVDAEQDEKRKQEQIKTSYEKHLISSTEEVKNQYNRACERKEKDQELEIQKRYKDITYRRIKSRDAKDALEIFQNMQTFYAGAKYCAEPSYMELSQKISTCEKRIKRRKWYPLLFLIVVVCVGGGIYLVVEKEYNKAIQSAENGEYEKANDIARMMGFYKSLDTEIEYIKSKNLLTEGKLNEAAEIIYELDHEGCDELVNLYNLESTDKYMYENAKGLDGIEAMEVYYELGDYLDSEVMAENRAYDYLRGEWIDENNLLYIEYGLEHGFGGEIIYSEKSNEVRYCTIQLATASTYKYEMVNYDDYEIVDYQFGYYEKNSFGIDITLQKTNSEETKILGIRNLENQSFEILGEGKFVVSA